jgi:hypothetical protein
VCQVARVGGVPNVVTRASRDELVVFDDDRGRNQEATQDPGRPEKHDRCIRGEEESQEADHRPPHRDFSDAKEDERRR